MWGQLYMPMILPTCTLSFAMIITELSTKEGCQVKMPGQLLNHCKLVATNVIINVCFSFRAVINLPETLGIPFCLKVATFMDFLSVAVSSELIFIWKYRKVHSYESKKDFYVFK